MNLNPKDESILELLKDIGYRRYFLSEYDDVKLFYIFKDSGYFEHQKEPLPLLIDDGKFYSTPEWEILRYLEKISLNIEIKDYDKYALEILNIINNVTKYHIDKSIEIDNYLTWWYCVKILVNIPNDIISLSDLENLRIWINAKFINSMICSEIIEKLIPKFLNNTAQIKDIRKAELIIDIISAVKKEEKKVVPKEIQDIWTDKEKYRLIFDGYYFKDFVNKYHKLIAEKCSDDLIFKICNTLKSTLEREILTYSSTEDDFNIHFAISKIGNNYEILSEEYYKSDRYFGLNKLFGEKLKPLKSVKFSFVARNLVEFSDLLQKYLIENDLIKGDDKRMKLSRGRYLYYGPFSINCWESLRTNEHLANYDANDMILYLLKKILIYSSRINIKSLKIILKKLFLEDYFIFKKLALLIIGKSNKDYSDVFWEIFNKNDSSNILLEETYFGDELDIALPKIKLDLDQQGLLLKIIEEGPKFFYYKPDDEYFNLWKQKLLKALSHYPLFENQYKLLLKITQKDYSLGPAIGDIQSEIIDDSKKVTVSSVNDILKMDNNEIVDRLLDIKNFDVFDSKDNSYYSYNEALKIRPDKFTADLTPFLKAYHNDIFYLLYNLDEAWKNKKYFNWKNLLEFILSFLENINFDDINLSVDYTRGSAGLKDIIGLIGNLIQDGTRTDDNAFPEECNDIARLILSKIFSNYKKLQYPYTDEDRKDSFIYSLNSILGRNVLALILFSLKEARIKFGNLKDDSVKWNIEHKIIYDELLDNSVYEAYLFLGNSIRNFIYLDKNWIYKKVESITELREKNILLWNAFMDGYLFNQIIGKDLFHLMKENYEFSIDFDFKDESSRKGLIRHFGIIYLGGSDNIEDGLILKIIKRNNYKDLRELIYYFLSQKEIILIKTSPENDELLRLSAQRILIINFWRTVFNEYIKKPSFTEDEKKILSNLGKLIDFIENIDKENLEWCKLSAKYLKYDYNSPSFIESLNKLKDKGEDQNNTANFIGEIYLAISEGMIPEYKMKSIIEIIEYLFNSKNKEAIESANLICDIYAQRSNYSLKEIWEKYNNFN